MGRVRFLTAMRAAVLATVAALCCQTTAANGGEAGCPGDCNHDGAVIVNELIIGVNIALELQPASACEAMDFDHDLRVTVDELIRAVVAATTGSGCPDVFTPTSTASVVESTATATAPSVSTPTSTAGATDTATAVATDAATVTNTPEPTSTALATHTPTEIATDTPEVSATPTTTPAPPTNPSGLTAVIDGEVVRLAWTPPDSLTGYTFARVLRRLNAAVAGPDDAEATPIFFGEASHAADAVAALLPDVAATPRTYHYAVFGCTDAEQCETIGAATTLTPTLVQALRAGGYTLHWRHASATVCEDQLCLGTAATALIPDWWKSCEAACPPDVGEPSPGMCPNHTGTATARQLNADGVHEAIAIGDAFAALAIPVGRVMSSEYCRNLSTAALMNFGPPTELVPNISYFVYDELNRCEHVYDLIDAMPAGGTNNAIIGHAGFSASCAVIDSLAWSEVAIFKPDGQGDATYITRLTWDQWPALVAPGPTALAAALDDDTVHLTWTGADPAAGFTSVRLLRRLNAPVAGPNDGAATVLFSGTGTSFDDDAGALLPDIPNTPRTYHYAVYGCAGARCETTGAAATVTRQLADLLRGGGYTLFWRHADADVCVDNTALGTAANTSRPDWWKSCNDNCATATARQISQAGRDHALAISTYFHTENIPIGRVLSSEFCRNFTTAELFDFGPVTELDPTITFFVYDEANRCQSSYARIAEVPAAGTNTAIIGHAGFASSCPVLSALAWSEAAIFKPDGQGGSTLIGRVTWDQWAGS